MDFGGALKRPFSDIKKLVIGIILYWIPIISLFAVGYSLECARLTFKKKKTLPDWTGWGGLFVHGLLTAIISIIFMIPAIILFAIAVAMAGASLLSTLATGSITALTGLMTSAPMFILSGLLFLLTAYVTPSAVLGYAKKFKFGDAFCFGTVFKKAFTGKYFVAWLVSTIVTIVLAAILGLIPIVGPAVAGFIGIVISMTLLAEAYK